MKKVCKGLGTVLVLLVAIVVIRASGSAQLDAPKAPAPLSVQPSESAERLGKAISFRTISHQDLSQVDTGQLTGFHQFLRESFPLTYAKLTVEMVSEYGLVYRWQGSDATRSPILLIAHMDVVPVDPGTEKAWTHPPFAGEVADGFVWGRGTLDFKQGVMGIHEATEALLAEGFVPKRTVYIGLGFDEEVGGVLGAKRIAAHFAALGLKFDFVLDEGLAVTKGMMPGIDSPVALIGIAEKGYLSVELLVEQDGGHSSMPEKETAVGILAGAISRLETTQMAAAIDGPAREFFDTIAPYMPFGQRLALRNLWLLEKPLTWKLTQKPATNALIRTTTAPTMLEGSVKENVLASRARAVVNFRIRPGDTVQSVLEHVHAVVDDARVKVNPGEGAADPSPMSPSDCWQFDLIEQTIREIYPDAVVAPSLMLGMSDARHYAPVSEHLYRFAPMMFTDQDRGRVHGINERIATGEYAKVPHFYAQLIRNSSLD
ncbi:MAG: hypothetical protein A2289_03625 [Deltaproteobacteria bacterium RIFOXYA12_FULL_58_15]|nr:MAG: hypothetical protein A2289_03625 [Deltaproteobacteria bacterium RIFOXYA12_FULL_58_15]OGR12607.1 MAG: hypothetical protein A2341_24935 [Deltaproteobacteria bacterium RIFOXYB12_FULL_58_9]